MINIPKHIRELQPYKAGKPVEELVREKGLRKIVKLASNENPLGPSPKAMEAIEKNIKNLHRYTNPSAYKLVHAVAEKYGKKPEQIITCSGSDSLIQYILTAFCNSEDEILTSEGTFIGLYVNANKYNIQTNLIQLKDYHLDLNAIMQNITAKTKIIYLANPNNPTGTIFTKAEFELFMKSVPDNVLVILDEAYTVYAEFDPEYPNGLEYDFDNLIVLRTLSKAYGLAGIRIGIGFGPEYLIHELYKVKLPFEPNLLAQVSAASALNDDEFLEKTKALNEKSLGRFKKGFIRLGIKFVDTHANFYLLLFPSKEFAIDFNEACLNNGLILRHVDTFGIPNGIRINSGTDDETEFALSVINRIYPKLIEKHKLSAV